MLFKMIRTVLMAYRTAQERRFPTNIRRIDGELYAYCHIRKAWRKVRFHGEK